ncbi:MAG TPA: insulinase family protein [Vicinamibacterales bacterium]|nr:insulinase family protein [Vicinamibacterales bacterium]
MKAIIRSVSSLAAVVLLGTGSARGQAPRPAAAAPLSLQEQIPLDAAVRTGRLANGVTYFIRQNGRPASRMSLRLAVKAGSLYEADDQQGLAHLIEHMAFNGSAHFKPGELVSYFETVGARLGPHVNAYTSFDETVYMLDLPTDNSEVVSKGLQAMADFAGGLTLSDEEINKERGVVIEEWRGRLGAATRVREQQVPVLYYKSRYADRSPIGKPEILRNAPPQRLRDFYDTWYRPERMAIIVVGDVKPEMIEATIRSTFGTLAARAAAVPPPDNSVPLHTEDLVSIVTDPEVTASSVQILHKRPADGNRLVSDYRRSIVGSLFSRMLNDRFGDLARRPDAKFLSAGGGGGSLSRTVDTFGLNARVPDGGITDGLAAIQVEARRVRQFGFTASELERARMWMRSFYERAYNERDKNESAAYAQEYLAFFLNDEPSPGIEYEWRLVQQVLPTISLDEVTALATQRLGGEGEVILATMPQKDSVKAPAEADIRAALASADRVALTPWSDTTTTRTLVEHPPQPASVVSRRELADIGVTVVKFSNGVEAWLKPTDFKNDQVLFTMYAPGGTSLASQDEYLQASFATNYVGLSGLGGIKALDLDKMLAGKLASASPFISDTTHGISGSAAPADLETALQLAFLDFTAPGDDPEAFALMRRQLDAAVANRGRSPGQAFSERVEAINTSNHYTAQPLTAERVATLDRTRMMTFYRQRFSNAADFTFFMVGAFTVDSAVPLLAKWVGGLPSTGTKSSAFRDIGVRFPAGTQRAEVQKGREPRAQTLISFFADPSFEPAEQERIIAATTVLETVLRDALREDLGQTYTVSVGLSQSPPQRGDGYVAVQFGAAPENIGAMTERVIREVRKVQEEGVPADLVAKAREGARRDYETALKQNNYWLRRLQTVHLLGGNPGDIITRGQRIDAVTPALVQETFRKYFPMDRYTVVTLLPEGARP